MHALAAAAQVGNNDFPVTETSQQHELPVWGFESLGEGDTCDCWAQGSGAIVGCHFDSAITGGFC